LALIDKNESSFAKEKKTNKTKQNKTKKALVLWRFD
jgi:hypothetical protein